MFNILLDPLPEKWNGYPIDTDFQTGIMISQCLEDKELSEREKIYTALSLLFPQEDMRPPFSEAVEALEWWMTEFNHDKHKKQESGPRAVDFDIDQWRIYAAFLNQYGIDLNNTKMHWFCFMGLLSNLEECSFSRVIDIRQKKITGKMQKEEKKYFIEMKKVYALRDEEKPLTEEEKAREAEALELFNRLRNQ